MRVKGLYASRFCDSEKKAKDRIWKVLCKSYFQKYVPDDSVVIDIAAGYGEFINNINTNKNGAKYAIDINPETEKHLNDGVTFINGSATNISTLFEKEFADVIFISNFLKHIKEKEIIIIIMDSIYKVLKPDGKVIILQPNIKYCYKQYWDFFDHHTPISDSSLKELLLLTGFEIEKIIPRFLPFSTKQNLPKHPFFVWIYLKIPILWKVFGKQALAIAMKK